MDKNILDHRASNLQPLTVVISQARPNTSPSNFCIF